MYLPKNRHNILINIHFSVIYLYSLVYSFMPHKEGMHKGEHLHKVVKEKGIRITVLMKRLGYKDRSSFYTHIAKPDLSYEILMRYGKILHYDFSEYFQPSTADAHITHDELPDYKKETITLEQLYMLVAKIQQQCTGLQEKYNELREENERLNAKITQVAGRKKSNQP